jgi:hypothetical protein
MGMELLIELECLSLNVICDNHHEDSAVLGLLLLMPSRRNSDNVLYLMYYIYFTIILSGSHTVVCTYTYCGIERGHS